MGGAFDGGVDLTGRDFAGMLETLPREEKRISKARIDEIRFRGCCSEIAKELLEADKILLLETSAGVNNQGLLEKLA